jgi:NAD(P)-dependent dehydrogenase (short-subunit alcohol dehydrogenase family)
VSRITTAFNAQSTAADVIAGVDLTGKHAVVTGGASGIGLETAHPLAAAGAQVTLAVRNTDAGEQAAADIQATTGREYDTRYAGLLDQVDDKLAALTPADADPTEVARQIVRVVDLPKGQRPFRVHIDPANDGAEEVNTVGDRIREQFYQRIGLADLLRPAGAN